MSGWLVTRWIGNFSQVSSTASGSLTNRTHSTKTVPHLGRPRSCSTRCRDGALLHRRGRDGHCAVKKLEGDSQGWLEAHMERAPESDRHQSQGTRVRAHKDRHFRTGIRRPRQTAFWSGLEHAEGCSAALNGGPHVINPGFCRGLFLPTIRDNCRLNPWTIWKPA